jgi:hypothetical protein
MMSFSVRLKPSLCPTIVVSNFGGRCRFSSATSLVFRRSNLLPNCPVVVRQRNGCLSSRLQPNLALPNCTASLPIDADFLCRTPQSFSTTSENKSDTGEEKEIVLFQRSTGKNTHVTIMRSGFAVACFNTAYWLWYTTEFLPTINASEHEFMHTDPTLGVVGLMLAGVIQAIFVMYPRRMVSTLCWKPESQTVVAYAHTLPWIMPSSRPSVSFPVGSALVTAGGSKRKTLLDPTSDDAQTLIEKYDGDLTAYRGYLPIGYSWPPYVLQIIAEDNVREPALLLEALLRTEHMGSRSSYSDEPLRTTRGKKRIKRRQGKKTSPHRRW